MKQTPRTVAVAVLILGLALAVAPAVNSAESKTPRTSFLQILRLPALFAPTLSHIRIVDPALTSIAAPTPAPVKVRPTEDIQIPKVGKED